jgi:hypothetical protein
MTKRILLGLVLGCAAGSALAADFSSVIFYEYTHNATEGVAEDGKWDNTRAYLTMADKPADNLSYKLTIDAGRNGGDGDTQILEYFVKNAYVDWNNDFGKWSFGVIPMNLYNLQEATFGHRFLSAPIMDIHKFSASADLGMGWAKSFGPVNTSLTWTNGTGYKKAENDKYKKLAIQLNTGETNLSKKDGWNAGIAYSMEPMNADDSKTVMGLFGGWAGMGARLGAEFDTKTTTGAVDVTEQIIGLYATYKLPISMDVDLLLQMDMFDPNTDADDDGQTELIVGAKFYPAKGLVIAPNMKTTSFEVSGSDPATYYRVNFEFKI